MKKASTLLSLAFATLGMSHLAIAQNEFYNDGAAVHVQAGGLIYVQGDIINDDQGVNVGTMRNIGDIQLTGNWSNTSASSNVFTAADPGMVTFLGTGAVQTIGGTNFTAFNFLTINKSGATTQEVRQLIHSQCDGILNLTNDFLNTQVFLFNVNNPIAGAIVRAGGNVPAPSYTHSMTQGYVTSTPGSQGRLVRVTTASTRYFFPVGNSTRWRPVEITTGAGALPNNYGVQFVNLPTPNTAIKAPTLATINPAWYHYIDRFAAAPPEIVRIYHDFTADNICDISMVTMAEWSRSPLRWEDLSPTASLNPAPQMSWTEKNTYPGTYLTPFVSDSFALAGLFFASGAMSCVFPVEYLYLDATALDNSIMLNWETATEVNNAGFEVHRSTDGINFSQVGFVHGVGNSSSPTPYDYEDFDVVPNQRYFYRLRQVDFNGGQSTSNTVEAIILKGMDYVIGGFFPNPSNGNVNLWMTLGKDMPFELEVYDAIGKIVHREQRDVHAGYQQLDFNFSRLSKGSYLAHLRLNGEVITRKLAIQ